MLYYRSNENSKWAPKKGRRTGISINHKGVGSSLTASGGGANMLIAPNGLAVVAPGKIGKSEPPLSGTRPVLLSSCAVVMRQ